MFQHKVTFTYVLFIATWSLWSLINITLICQNLNLTSDVRGWCFRQGKKVSFSQREGHWDTWTACAVMVFTYRAAAPQCSWEHFNHLQPSFRPSPSPFPTPTATNYLEYNFSLTSIRCPRGSWSYWCTKWMNYHGNWELYIKYCSSPVLWTVLLVRMSCKKARARFAWKIWLYVRCI